MSGRRGNMRGGGNRRGIGGENRGPNQPQDPPPLLPRSQRVDEAVQNSVTSLLRSHEAGTLVVLPRIAPVVLTACLDSLARFLTPAEALTNIKEQIEDVYITRDEWVSSCFNQILDLLQPPGNKVQYLRNASTAGQQEENYNGGLSTSGSEH